MEVIADDAVEVRAQGWRTLAALHGPPEESLEKALQAGFGLSVVEFTVLDTLDRQDGWHMRMQQLSRAAALSHSATTRLVTRLENRGPLCGTLCDDDRRGIYSNLTDDGSRAARPGPPGARQHPVRHPRRGPAQYRKLAGRWWPRCTRSRASDHAPLPARRQPRPRPDADDLDHGRLPPVRPPPTSALP